MSDRASTICAGIVFVGLISAFALPEAISSAPNSDFAIVGPHDEVICAKSKEVCLTALKAIQRGWWTPFNSRDTSLLRCVPKPDCFPPETLCIKGYNCK
jgi:hypothetical protein